MPASQRIAHEILSGKLKSNYSFAIRSKTGGVSEQQCAPSLLYHFLGLKASVLKLAGKKYDYSFEVIDPNTVKFV